MQNRLQDELEGTYGDVDDVGDAGDIGDVVNGGISEENGEISDDGNDD